VFPEVAESMVVSVELALDVRGVSGEPLLDNTNVPPPKPEIATFIE
jgi:hypothetical protein